MSRTNFLKKPSKSLCTVSEILTYLSKCYRDCSNIYLKGQSQWVSVRPPARLEIFCFHGKICKS